MQPHENDFVLCATSIGNLTDYHHYYGKHSMCIYGVYKALLFKITPLKILWNLRYFAQQSKPRSKHHIYTCVLHILYVYHSNGDNLSNYYRCIKMSIYLFYVCFDFENIVLSALIIFQLLTKTEKGKFRLKL